MKKIAKSFFALSLLGLLLSSCQSTYYTPGVQRAPALQEEGEITVAASGSVYSRSVSTDFHAAYSPIKNVGIMVNGNLFSPQETRNTFDNTVERIGMKGQYLEIAPGYYQPVADNVSFELYGGYGRLFNGKTPALNNNSLVTSFEYNKVFIQPAFCYRGEVFEVAPSLRLSRINFQQVSTPVSDPDNGNIRSFVQDGDNFTMVEPSITIGVGYRYVKFQVSIGTAYSFRYDDFGYDPIALSAGLLFNLRPSYAKKTTSEY